MLRLPTFTYHRPKTAAEAVAIQKEHGKEAMYVAGGTDLYPNMKRRHQTPTHVISLQDVPGLHTVDQLADGRVAIGAMVKLTALEHHAHLKAHYGAFRCCATWARSAATCCSTRAAPTTTRATSGASRSTSA
jgi:CO/xanthine dehydrogenase FAD-binding subunit